MAFDYSRYTLLPRGDYFGTGGARTGATVGTTDRFGLSFAETKQPPNLAMYGLVLQIFTTMLQAVVQKSYYSSQAYIARLQTDLLKETLGARARALQMESQLKRSYYETNSFIASLNARISEMQADLIKKITEIESGMLEDKAREAREIGQVREARYRAGVKRIIGRQRAALAAQGIRIDEGSARDILLETADIGEIDATTIKINAAKESFGYITQAIGTRIRGEQMAAGQRAGAMAQRATATDMMIRGAMEELAGNAEAIQNKFRMSWADLVGRSTVLEHRMRERISQAEAWARAGTLLTEMGMALREP